MEFTAKQLDTIEHALNVASLDCAERAAAIATEHGLISADSPAYDRMREELERYVKVFDALRAYMNDETTQP